MARYQQVGQIVSDAARDLGLGVINGAFESADPLVQRLCGFFNNCGSDLLHAWSWGQLKVLWEFTTQVGETGIYPLPDDWHEMVLQTGWDRTKRMPLGGPLSSQEWAYLRAMQMGVTLTALFRVESNELMLHPNNPVTPGILISMEYASVNWVVANAAQAAWQANHYNALTTAAGGQDSAKASTDWCLFDPQLIKLYLKLWWKREVGMDTTTAQEDYDKFLQKTIGSVSPPPTLRIDGPRLGVPNVHLIDNVNLPPTGYG